MRELVNILVTSHIFWINNWMLIRWFWLFIYFEKQSETDGQESERDHPSIGSLHLLPQQPGLGKAEARS